MTTTFLRRTTKILVVNPNSSPGMTHGIGEAIHAMGLAQSTEIFTYTAPSASPPSINNGKDVQLSCDVVYADLVKNGHLQDYDAVLVACFSVHPLVHKLGQELGTRGLLAVTGIFEASILAALSLLTPAGDGANSRWGIVTTGKFWEDHLAKGVSDFLGLPQGFANHKFAGIESTGLDAGDFHGGVDPAVIRQRLRDATLRLLRSGDVECVVMGCAGMAGLDAIIRSAAVEAYGDTKGKQVYIIDGITAGVGSLEQMVRNTLAFQGS